MINWKEIKGLHVIQRLEQIISKWYGVEVFFTDEHLRIQSNIQDKIAGMKAMLQKKILSNKNMLIKIKFIFRHSKNKI